MRFATLMGRATLVDGSGAGLDVEKASDGRFPAEPQSLFAQWDEFRQWAAAQDGQADLAVDPTNLHAPTPFPRQVFAIGLNYRSHAAESGLAVPPVPAVFTKFPTCVANPNETVALPSAYVDWEVELVVAIGRRAHTVAEQEAWQHVAGLMVGQTFPNDWSSWRDRYPSSPSASPTPASARSVRCSSRPTSSPIRTTSNWAAGSAMRSSSRAGPVI
jgi:2-keto-4-pentenoate hydratase/2-oxohepta-3-ene-1,7-dioic acid hydratase in catechol pathway